MGVGESGFFGLVVMKEGEKIVVTGFRGSCGGGTLEGREAKRI